MSFCTEEDQTVAAQALELIGLAGGSITRLPRNPTDAQSNENGMPAALLDFVARELQRAKAQQTPAPDARHWLVVRVPDDYLAGWVIEAVRATADGRVPAGERVTVDALLSSPTGSPHPAEACVRGVDGEPQVA
jgi:hypothetical protein